jgi:L-aspartate oxidase
MIEAVHVERFDFLAIGSGLAGLTYALRAAEHGSVCVLTKAEVTDANTSYAQGGIAAAVGEADSWELHERDTLEAGAGINDREAVRHLVTKAPDAIAWLQRVGTNFNVEPSGELDLELEGGHSRHRIVHYQDRTGAEVERAVVAEVRAHPNIRVIEHAFVTELLVSDGRCVGAAAVLDEIGIAAFSARAVLLGTGGCGVMYQHTTNPRVATGDGVALADAIGARIFGMEFMQFHPTTLYHPQLRGYLITEACRGAGGTLRNHLGRRFMFDYDERLELAPRDVVARAIDAEMKKRQTWCVYLDMTHLPPVLRSTRSYGLSASRWTGTGFPSYRRNTTRAAESRRTFTRRRPCRGSSRRAKWPGAEFTARTAWRATAFSKRSYSRPQPPRRASQHQRPWRNFQTRRRRTASRRPKRSESAGTCSTR